MEELAGIFRRDVGPRIRELRGAVVGTGPAAAEGVAHALRGASATLGLRHLAYLFARLEQRAGEGATDLSAELNHAERELDRALNRLRSLARGA